MEKERFMSPEEDRNNEAENAPDKADLIKEFTRRSLEEGWGQVRQKEELAKLGLSHKGESQQEILKPDELPKEEEASKPRKSGLGNLTKEEVEVLARRQIRIYDTRKLKINPDATPEEIEAAKAEQKAERIEERRIKGVEKFGLSKDSTIEDVLDEAEEKKRIGIAKEMDISPDSTWDEINKIKRIQAQPPTYPWKTQTPKQIQGELREQSKQIQERLREREAHRKQEKQRKIKELNLDSSASWKDIHYGEQKKLEEEKRLKAERQKRLKEEEARLEAMGPAAAEGLKEQENRELINKLQKQKEQLLEELDEVDNKIKELGEFDKT